jgi:hypothetical protein
MNTTASPCLRLTHAALAWLGLSLVLSTTASAAAEITLPSIGLPAWDGRANATQSRLVTIPEHDAGQVPLLRFQARIDKGDAPGAAYGLRIMLNELPLSQCFLQPRLLNKTDDYTVPDGSGRSYPWFKRIGLGLDHVRRENHAWLVPFANSFDTDDTDYVIDLAASVEPGTSVQLMFQSYAPNRDDNVTPYRKLAGAAPLIIKDVEVVMTPRAEVEAMRANACPEPVATIQPGGVRLGADDRAYEIERYGLKENPKPQIHFNDLTGWTLKAFNRDDDLRLDLSGRRQVWSDSTASVTINPKINYLMLLDAPEPIRINVVRDLEGNAVDGDTFDAVHVWYGGWYQPVYHKDAYTIQLWIVLEDAAGTLHFMDLGPACTETFGMAMGRLTPIQKQTITFPVRFRGIAMDTVPSNTRQSIYFDSIAFFRDESTPLAPDEIPDPPAPIPREAGGILPPVPAGIVSTLELANQVATLTSQTADRIVTYRLTPADGMLHGIEARLGEGRWFRPMGGGNIMLAQSTALNNTVPPGEAELVGVTERALTDSETASIPEAFDRAVEATFCYTHQGVTSEYTATYILEGFSLAVDVRGNDGRAMGINPGRLEGLDHPQFVRMPYLTALAIGMSDREFVLVGADWHNSDMADLDEGVLTPPDPDHAALGIAAPSRYAPLTDGRRLNLRDRWIVTVSDDLYDVMPSIPFAPSPRRAELAPYLYRMGGPRPDYAQTTHRYGIDRIIATDFYTTFFNRLGDVFTGLTEPAKGLDLKQIQAYRDVLRGLGYMPGDSADLYDMAVLSPRWDPRNAARTMDGRYVPGWTGCYVTKGAALPRLSGEFATRLKELYGLRNIYMDTHTNHRVYTGDLQAGAAGAGIARAAIYGNMQAMRDVARYCGSVTSEGINMWIFAGGPDMDYAQFSGYGADPSAYKLTVDFDLLRIHPRTIGLMMGYAPERWLKGDNLNAVLQDAGGRETPEAFYRYLSACMAFGQMAMIGYGYHPPMARLIHLYALMQGPQQVYLPDEVAEIRYHEGTRWLSTSDAFRASRRTTPGWDLYNQIGRVYVRYQGGLEIWVNYGEDTSWDVTHNGATYTLPNYGWLMASSSPKPKDRVPQDIPNRNPNPDRDYDDEQDYDYDAATRHSPLLSYSALIDGHRVDYVRCPDYIYVNTGGTLARLDIGRVDGAVWLKRLDNGWQVIPCGDLGKWVTRGPPWKSGDPAGRLSSDRCLNPPANRGVKLLQLDTRALMGCDAGAVSIEGRAFLTDQTTPIATATEDGLLVIAPTADVVDYILSTAE